jgi:hypothetical protein
MDLEVLLDRLDQLVQNAKTVPLTDQVRLERGELYELLDEIRATIPAQVRQARRVVAERQRGRGEVEREAEQLREEGRARAARARTEADVVRLAERQADAALAEARREAKRLLAEVDGWADGHLRLLERNLDGFLTAIRRGRQRLQERSQETVAAGIRARVDR